MKTKFLRLCLSAVCLGFLYTAASAMPARPGLFEMTQSDGTTVTVSLSGSENGCIYISEDGYLLLPGKNGDLCYGILTENGEFVASDRIAHDSGLRTHAENELLNTIDKQKTVDAYRDKVLSVRRAASRAGNSEQIGNYPALGRQKVLVILARFADVDYYHEDPNAVFTAMLNEKGYNLNGATGSARDYYITASCGQFQPDMTVFGPVTLPQKMAYYGEPSGTSSDARPAEMIRDACALLDDEIDFSEYDLNGDGYIDNVYLFYPGYSQADGANANTIWPHSGFAWSSLMASFDGVRLDRYACSNEIELGTDALVGIGTFCHEFTHVLGLPDLYPVDYSHNSHPDSWSLMANGGRNNDGKTPPVLSSYERYTLGWLNPEVLTVTDGITTLPDLQDSNKAYIIKTTKDNEYFMIENRQQKDWDTYLPGHGMLVWHIDYDKELWTQNIVNIIESHQCIDLVKADGVGGSTSLSSDAFPGTTDRTWIANSGTPNLKSWDASECTLGIYNIFETTEGDITFNAVDTSSDLAAVTMKDATDISPVSFTANWNRVDGAESYILDVYSLVKVGTSTMKVYVQGYRLRQVDGGDVTSISVDGLQPLTEYRYQVRALGGGKIGNYSSLQTVVTSDKDFRFFYPETASATDITSSSFTANWKAMDGAQKYSVSVYEVTDGEQHVSINDFTGNITAPKGWSVSTSCALSSFSGYYGNQAPGLTMSSDAYVQSPVESESEVESVSFWYRGTSEQEENELRVFGYINDEWKLLHTITPIGRDRTGYHANLDRDDLRYASQGIRIEYFRSGGIGSAVIDDVEVTFNNTTHTPLEGYIRCDAGNRLSMTVSGLKPSTHYRYDIVANNGMLDSKTSAKESVHTAEASGIADTTTATSVRVAGGTGEIIISGNYSKACAYNLSGEAMNSFTVPAGFYIVLVDGKSYKVIVR